MASFHKQYSCTRTIYSGRSNSLRMNRTWITVHSKSLPLISLRVYKSIQPLKNCGSVRGSLVCIIRLNWVFNSVPGANLQRSRGPIRLLRQASKFGNEDAVQERI
jgi:hypothetical protein